MDENSKLNATTDDITDDTFDFDGLEAQLESELE